MEKIVFTEREKKLIDYFLLGLGFGPDRVKSGIAVEDEMFLHNLDLGQVKLDAIFHYLNNGAQMFNTVRQVLKWSFGGGRNVDSFLDFACGYGRFTRFLTTELPPSKVTVSDIYERAVSFQKKYFGVNGINSTTSPSDYYNKKKYDCIFVASLFSHLPETSFKEWLNRLSLMLTDRGVLIFSVHDISCMPGDIPIDDNFVFIPDSESRSLDKESYGTSYVSEEFVVSAIKNISNKCSSFVRLKKGLCGFQDLYVFSPDKNKNFSKLKVLSLPLGNLERCSFEADGNVHFSGWAADFNEQYVVKDVQIFVNGNMIQHCQPIHKRQDVADHFNDEKGLFSGWSCEIQGGEIKPSDVFTVKVMNSEGMENIISIDEFKDALNCQASHDS